MTTYSFAEAQTTLRIDYEDPAGGCAGWFLHVVHTPGQFDNHGSSPPFWGLDAEHDDGSPSAQSARGDIARKSILNRLERMFGSAGCVKWTATLVESVTPATIDDNF